MYKHVKVLVHVDNKPYFLLAFFSLLILLDLIFGVSDFGSLM